MRDHNFTGCQQSDYDSLKASGRTYYDELRWQLDATHAEAFKLAVDKYGFKNGGYLYEQRNS